MNNLTNNFTNTYHPEKSLVVFKGDTENDYYVESFDFDANGRMINAHPLNWTESRALGEILLSEHDKRDRCFESKGLIPDCVLQIKTGNNGFVIWYTPAMERDFLFIDDLNLPEKSYPVPALLWIANQDKLSIFAIKDIKKPTLETQLFKAPFFNIYATGVVCMGTVDVEFTYGTYLEEFIEAWQNYFFNSKFSHLLEDRSPVKSNFMQFCQRIAGSKKFPVSELIKTNKKLKHIVNGNA